MTFADGRNPAKPKTCRCRIIVSTVDTKNLHDRVYYSTIISMVQATFRVWGLLPYLAYCPPKISTNESMQN